MGRTLIAGCGFFGECLARELLSSGEQVWALRRGAPSAATGAHGLRCDLRDARLTRHLPASLDHVVFCASPDGSTEQAYRDTYWEGLQRVLEAPVVRRASRVLLTSSTAVYGRTDGSWVDEQCRAEPAGFAGRILLESERRLLDQHGGGQVLRLSGLYGPGRERLLQRVAAGRAAFDARHRYTNRIHVDDAAALCAMLLRRPRDAPIVIGSDEHPVLERTLLEWLATRLQAPSPEPSSAATKRAYTNKRCRSLLVPASGYRFRYPSFREGYVELVRAYLGERSTT